MFLALSEFDNFLFEFDKISLLAVAAGSRGVAPSVLNVDSEEGGGSFSRVPVQQTQNRSKNVAFKAFLKVISFSINFIFLKSDYLSKILNMTCVSTCNLGSFNKF